MFLIAYHLDTYIGIFHRLKIKKVKNATESANWLLLKS